MLRVFQILSSSIFGIWIKNVYKDYHGKDVAVKIFDLIFNCKHLTR